MNEDNKGRLEISIIRSSIEAKIKDKNQNIKDNLEISITRSLIEAKILAVVPPEIGHILPSSVHER